MAKRSYRDLFGISRKWLGLYLEIILKIRGSSWKFVGCGLIVEKGRGWIYFSMANHGGLGPPLVNHWHRGSTVNRGHGRPKSSQVLGLAAAPGLDGSSAIAQHREGSMGSPSRASPGHGRLCGGRAMGVKRRQWWCSVGAVLERRERRRRVGRGAVEDGSGSPFYRGQGGAVGGLRWWNGRL
jgi:hypothetical protein